MYCLLKKKKQKRKKKKKTLKGLHPMFIQNINIRTCLVISDQVEFYQILMAAYGNLSKRNSKCLLAQSSKLSSQIGAVPSTFLQIKIWGSYPTIIHIHKAIPGKFSNQSYSHIHKVIPGKIL